MRQMIFAGIFFLVLIPAAQANGKAEDLFSQAVKKYQEADYKAAAALNEKILTEERVESAAVYFNLGNAYLKQGELGKAVFEYRRARNLAPRDADIRANLAFARSLVGVASFDQEGKTSPFWLRPFDTFSSAELKSSTNLLPGAFISVPAMTGK